MKFVRKIYLSTVLMWLVIFWWFVLLNLTEINLPLSVKKISVQIFFIVIFVIQFIIFISFVVKNKNKEIFKKENFLSSIPNIICAIIALFSVIAFYTYREINEFMNIALIILSFEMIIIRLFEVSLKDKWVFSQYNSYFEPKYNLELIKNKSYKNLYYKGNNIILDNIGKGLSVFLIFCVIWIIIFRYTMGPYPLENFIALVIMYYLTSAKTMFIIDKLMKNIVFIECKCSNIKQDGGAHPSGRTTYYFINEKLKFKTFIGITKAMAYKKDQKITLVIGGISHFVIEIIE